MKKNFKDKRNTNGFDKNPQNINRKGAPPKIFTAALNLLKEKSERLAKSQVIEVFEYLLTLKKEQVEAFANDNEQPIIIQVVASEMIKGKQFEIIERMLDRIHGKAIQETKINMNVDIEIEPETE